MKSGILIVVSGFSGAGKGTLMKKLLEKHANDYALSISATTRLPRPGEVNGREYFFVTKDEFRRMIDQDELIEYASYVDNFYGTPRKYVEEQLQAGKNVILEIEIQGALKVKEKLPETRLFFITAPSADELKNRLEGRGTETKEVIEARLSRAYEESLGIEQYDYFVINDEVDRAVEELHTLVMNECNGAAPKNDSNRTSLNTEYINKVRKELLSFSKGE